MRNDREGLAELLDSLAKQSEMPDEIVLVDGGSTDGTLIATERWDHSLAPLRVLARPNSPNAAFSRNVAVRAARHDLILCTDAGCRPVPGWVAALKRTLADADIAAGVFVSDRRTPFEHAVACAHYPVLEELDDPGGAVRVSHRLFGRNFRADQGGGRSLGFHRLVWEAAGGFPVRLYAGEDMAFVTSAIGAGCRSALSEEAVVHWRPRETWFETARMFSIYTRGDVRTRPRRRHALRLAAWLVGMLLAKKGATPGRVAVMSGVAAYLWLPIRRASRSGLAVRHWWRLLALVAVKDLSQLLGAALGLVDAARGVPQPRPGRRRSGIAGTDREAGPPERPRPESQRQPDLGVPSRGDHVVSTRSSAGSGSASQT